MTANDEVSSNTARALREAMRRLLAGKPERTDGRLTKANLGREADVSHATLFRATTILAEWDDAVTALGTRTRQQSSHNSETNSLRTSLAKKTNECTELRQRLDAAATVIATLHHENTALRQQVDQHGHVVPLRRHGAARPSNSSTGEATSGPAADQSDPDGDAT